MGELVFTFIYGGALVVMGGLVKAVLKAEEKSALREKELLIKDKKGSVI